MQPVEIPEFPRLRGEEAIEALQDFIRELEEQRGKELTDKQTTALTKLSLGLISSIEAENQPNRITNKRYEQMKEETRFITRLKKQLQNVFLNTLPF
ncbi:MAG: hypothetical protein OEY90_06720 [Candidatus Bathyarchaeota archaeon]|nr:hypothetical protein [Candidatus Bathyarchaeota archaeon]